MESYSIDELYTYSFLSYVNLQTGIIKHSETFSDNVFITPRISDHLTQFLIEPTTFLKDNDKSNTTHHCFNKGNFKNQITIIDWNELLDFKRKNVPWTLFPI